MTCYPRACTKSMTLAVCNRNRTGPRTEPCGTSYLSRASVELVFPERKNCPRSNRHDMNQRSTSPRMLYVTCRRSIVAWSTLSNAVERLSSICAVMSIQSSARRMYPRTFSSNVSVEGLTRYADCSDGNRPITFRHAISCLATCRSMQQLECER
jgi:hypothetical protein